MEPDRRAWSQRAHHFIANKLPMKVKTHGLAATGGEMLSNVEWYSVDSARWIHAAAYGTILVDFDGKMRIVAVSEHSTELKKSGNHGDHTAVINVGARKRIDKVCDEIGVTYDELREKMGARALFNVTVMSEVSKRPYVPVPVQSTLLVM
jgi:hypothetical protein